MEIEPDILDWLVSLELFDIKSHLHISPQHRYKVDQETTIKFSSGHYLILIIQRMLEKRNMKTTIFTNMKFMQNATTPVAKLYNWNLVAEALRIVELSVDQDVKNLIINGDLNMIENVLKQLYLKDKIWELPIDLSPKLKPKNQTTANSTILLDPSFGSQAISKTISKENLIRKISADESHLPIIKSISLRHIELLSQSKITSQPIGNTTVKEYEEIVDLDSVSNSKDLSTTNSSLEFILLTLMQALELPAKKVATFLTHKCKYLAHIIAKGAKGEFTGIIQWLQLLKEKYNQILSIILNEENKTETLNFFLQCIKPGLISRSFEVSDLTIELINSIVTKLNNEGYNSICWEWLTGDNGCLSACTLTIKRHSELKEKIYQMFCNFSQDKIVELYADHLQKIHNESKEFLKFVHEMIKLVLDDQNARQKIIDSSIIEEWLELALRYSEFSSNSTPETRVYALALLTDIWLTMPEKTDPYTSRCNRTVLLLRRGSREKSTLLNLTALTFLFNLLSEFARSRRPHAGLVYKNLVMTMCENHMNITMREFMIKNFLKLFERNKSIPIDLLLDPIIKQINISEGQSYILNMFDMDMLGFFSRTNKLSFNQSIVLMDILSKISLENVIFSNLAKIYLMHVINRFWEEDTMKEMTSKFLKICFTNYLSSMKKKKKIKVNVVAGKSMILERDKLEKKIELDMEKINAHKRAIIVEIIKEICKQKLIYFEKMVPSLAIYTNLMLKKHFQNSDNVNRTTGATNTSITYEEDNGMLAVLNLFGDPKKLINELEEEADAKISAIEASSKSQMVNEYEEKQLKLLQEKQKLIENRRLKTDKQTQYYLASLKGQQTDPKVQEKIRTIQENFSKDKAAKEMEERENALKYEKTKQIVRNALTRRNLEQGVSPLNEKNITGVLIFPEGTRDADQDIEWKHGLTEIHYVNYKEEEPRDAEFVDILFKKYKKLIKYLFHQYSSSGVTYKKTENFSSIQREKEKIKCTEAWKFCRDYGLKKLLKQEEMNSIFIATLQKMEPEELNTATISMDVQVFPHFLLQLGIFIYSRGANNISHLPAAMLFQNLLNQFRNEAIRKGQSTSMWDNPENASALDMELINYVNGKLLENPSIKLPENLQKYYEKNLKFQNCLPSSLKSQLPEPLSICYDIINDLLQKEFGGISLCETFITMEKIPKVKYCNVDPSKDREKDAYIPDPKKKSELPKKPKINQIITVIDERDDISVPMRLEVLKIPAKERYIAREIGFVLDEIFDCVSKSRKYEDTNKKIQSKKIENEAILMQQSLIAEEELEVEKQNEFIKKRRKELDKLIPTIKDKKKEKEKAKKQVELQAKIEVNKLKKISSEKVFERTKKIETDLKNKVETRKKNLEESLKKQTSNHKPNTKEFVELNTKKIDQLKKLSQSVKLAREKEKETELNRSAVEKKMKEEWDKHIHEVLEKEKLSIIVEEDYKVELSNQFNSPEVQAFWASNNEIIGFLFDYYLRGQYVEVNLPYHEDELRIDGLRRMLLELNLSPTILSFSDVLLIYKQIINYKPLIDKKQNGLKFNEFLMFLMMLIFKKKDVFVQFYENSLKVKNKSEKISIQGQNKSKELKCLEGFLLYCDLKNVKIRNLKKRLNEIRIDEAKAQPNKFRVQRLKALSLSTDVKKGDFEKLSQFIPGTQSIIIDDSAKNTERQNNQNEIITENKTSFAEALKQAEDTKQS